MNTPAAEHIVNKAIIFDSTLPSDTLLTYLRDLLRWNPQLGLVSRRDPLAACERLVLESLELLAMIRSMGAVGPGTRCVDIGSGGGFPGLVWALAEPEWHFLLVERKVGRAAFLQAEVLRLGLERVVVFAGPLEEAVREDARVAAFDVAVSVAVGSAEKIGPGVEPLLVTGGCLAGTVASDAALPERVAGCLVLRERRIGNFGNYWLYVKTSDDDPSS